ncbi:MAG: GumC domain-containing protein, partial [Planctomycetota bacterium]
MNMTSQGESPASSARPAMRIGSKLLLALAVLSLVTVAVVWILIPPKYWAEAFVECVSNRPVEPFSLVQPALRPKEHERFINGQARLIKSPEVLLAALRTAEVRSTAWFRDADKKEFLDELENDLVSAPVGGTNFIRVSMGCRERTDPAQIVHQVVSRYLSAVRDRAKAPYRQELEAYKNERETLDEQVRCQRRQIADLAAMLPHGAVNACGSILDERLRVNAQQVEAYELQTMELEGLSQIYSGPAGPGVSARDQRLVEQDPLIIQLKNQELTLELEQQAGLPETPENKEALQRLAKRLAAVKEKLDELRSQKLTEVLDHRREQVRTAFLNSQHALLLAREKLAETEAIQSDRERKLVELKTLEDELQLLKDTRDRVTEFVREIERVTGAQGSAVQVAVVQH